MDNKYEHLDSRDDIFNHETDKAREMAEELETDNNEEVEYQEESGYVLPANFFLL